MKRFLYFDTRWLLAASIISLAASCGKPVGKSPVGEEINVESVTLSQSSLELVVKEKQGLYGKIMPENASNKKLVWSVDDESIAIADNYGHVVGVAPGKTMLHVFTDDGGKSASCEVAVYASRDVYITGTSRTPSVENSYEALLWTNGKAEKLPSDQCPSLASDVFATDTDVYVAGNIYINHEGYEDLASVPVIWKNGTMVTLGNAGGWARSVFVHESDVYVSGNNDGHACIWKNGEISILAESGSVNSVFIVREDVYAAGYENIYSVVDKFTTTARVWKNGIRLPLSDAENSIVEKVFVSDGDVYSAGSADAFSEPRLWKNGDSQHFEDDSVFGYMTDVYVDGKDVYVCGPYLWKNGMIEKPDDQYPPYKYTSVFVSGNNIYVTGTSMYAGLWINGKRSDPPIQEIKYAESSGLFVKYRK